MKIHRFVIITLVGTLIGTVTARGDVTATIRVEVDKPAHAIPPQFFGLMTEEINHSYDGGLYAELIQNRTFQDPQPRERGGDRDRRLPLHWFVVGSGTARTTDNNPVNAALPTAAQGPRSLEDLLKDPRLPGLRRHLRQLYADPLTGKEQWGLVKDSKGSILGVHSLAEGKPVQRTGFEPQLGSFEDAENYRQWVFGLPVVQAVQKSAVAR